MNTGNIYDPLLINLNDFEDKVNMNKELNEFIPVIIDSENHLKYNKYNFNIDMSTNKNQNSNNNFESENTKSNKNKNNINEFGIDVEKISNIANTGIGLMGSFLNTVNQSFKEFETNVDTELNRNTNKQSTRQNSRNQITYFKHEDDNYYYIALEIPRVKRDDCNIKINDKTLTVIVKTEALNDGFSFLENRELEISLDIPFIFNPQQIVARNSNGMLYISINKNLFVNNNININILD
jgi:HSP20 family molecular chaperone IbpA